MSVNDYSKFVFKLADKISWFPGHMYKASQLLKENLNNIDFFIEIRDARVPISSKNIEFDEFLKLAQKPKITIFNKYDLCNKDVTKKYVERMNQLGLPSTCVSLLNKDSPKQIIEFAKSKFPAKFATVGNWMVIGGMPNVGKSTILNKIKNIYGDTADHKRSVAKVAPIPCTTKSLSGFKVSKNPLCYLIDTPGIMVPRFLSEEAAFKLALIGSIKDNIVSKEVLLEYLVWSLNKKNMSKKIYKVYGIEKEVLTLKDLFFEVRDRYKLFNYDSALEFIIQDFRKGTFGCITLDEEEILMEN